MHGMCPADLLESPTIDSLNFWLSCFVIEARRADGKQYPASTINNILAGLYRNAKAEATTGVVVPNFIDTRNPEFRDLRGAMQVCFRKLRESGVGALVKHAPIITVEEENLLWETKTFGDHDPLALLRTVFFYAGKAFCLRGGQEQRDLKRSQVVRSYNPDKYTYVENGSKNYSGINPNEVNKIVPILLPMNQSHVVLSTYLTPTLPSGRLKLSRRTTSICVQRSHHQNNLV